MANDNPLGLEASELAASKRAKAAAAARAAAQPKTLAQQLQDTVAQINSLKGDVKSFDVGLKGLASDAAVYSATTKENLAAQKEFNVGLAKDLGATIDTKTGMIVPPTGGYPLTSTTPATVMPTTPAADSNALTALNALFVGYGFPPDFANYIRVMFAAGYQDAATIANIAQNPKAFTSSDPAVNAAFAGLSAAWQARFPGNQLRMANGLDPLPVSQYIANEQSYKQVMQMAGLPASTLDVGTLGKLMAVDVSPQEVQARVNAAMQVVNSEDPFVIQQLQTVHGMTLGTIALHLLDPSIAAPVIQQQVAAAQIGAEFARVGNNINQDTAMRLAGMGVTQGQAQQGAQNISTQQAALQTVANQTPAFLPAGAIGGALQTATFGVPGAQSYAESQAQLTRLKEAAANPFGGSSGVGKGSLLASEEGIS